MFKKMLSVIITSVVFATLLMGDETTVVIKVSGPFALINKGKNQGVQEGQIYFVKRQTGPGLSDICKVKIFRATANRAAIEQVRKTKKPVLQKGDQLFSSREINSAMLRSNKSKTRSQPVRRSVAKKRSPIPDRKSSGTKSTSKPVMKTDPTLPATASTDHKASSVKFRSYARNLKTPWVTFHGGAIFPNGDLAVAYSPSIMFGGSYMVGAVAGFNLGIDVSNSFFRAPFGGGVSLPGAANTSSSLLEAHVVLQRFFGKFFFVEGGGGIYRPKISTTSIDNFKTTISSTNFGVFGGTGFFIPTSEYAGILLKGRVHTYFDQSKKQYFGLSGGFRFKVN